MFMTRIISISNRKGGSGKTTTAVNVSAALAHRGKSVLIIDADPQAHTTLSFGIRQRDVHEDLYSVLAEGKCPQEVMAHTYVERLKIIPATRRLHDYERSYARNKDSRLILSKQLAGLNGDFDYLVIDTPPTLSLLTVSSLIASEEVYIPMQTHFLCLEGLAEMIGVVRKIRAAYGTRLAIKGIIPTFYKERTRLSKMILQDIAKNLGRRIILHPVRVNISLAEAPSFGKTIFQYNMNSNGARDYLAVAQQIESL